MAQTSCHFQESRDSAGVVVNTRSRMAISAARGLGEAESDS
jgi:hypothetical protein